MDAEIVKAFELVLVFGAVLAFGFYELWCLRRSRDADSKDGSADRSDGPSSQ